MPREALVFLIIIITAVFIAIVIYVASTSKNEFDTDTRPQEAPAPDDDTICQTRDTLAENNAHLEAKALETEIARKKEELARLEAAVEAAADPAPQPQPKKKKKHGCLSTISGVCFMVVVFALIGGDGNDTTGTKSTYTARPQTTAVIKQNTVSPSIIKTAVSNALEKLDLFDYCSVSCDETAVTIYVGINDIAEDLAKLKASGENENNEGWITIKDSLMTVYNQVVGALADYGYTNQNCMLNLINTKNHDNILLMIHGGRIVYDAMQ